MKRKLVIDADHLLYLIDYTPPASQKRALKGKSLKTKADPLPTMKKAFKRRIREYEDIAQIEAVMQGYKLGKTIVAISDESNFRYDIYPEYKANRKDVTYTPEFIALRTWVRKKYALKQNVEADDIVAHYVRHGAVGFTTDKDLYKGVAGIWYNCHHYHNRWVYTTEEEATKFNLLQMLMGDLTDNIRGIEGVGIKTAEKLLDTHGWNWKGVVLAYLEKGYKTEDAILTRRLISMEQWSPKKGLKLFGDSK